MNKSPRLETARLCLQPLAEENLETLHALWTDPQVRKFLWDDIVIVKEATQAVLASSRSSFEEHGFGFWNVLLTKTRQFAGFCGLRFVDETPEVEILYGLWPEFWGKGFATEAAQAVLRYGFEGCDLDRIVAGTDPPNAASLRVIERLGMKFHRRDRRNALDVIYYSLKREETIFINAGAQKL